MTMVEFVPNHPIDRLEIPASIPLQKGLEQIEEIGLELNHVQWNIDTQQNVQGVVDNVFQTLRLLGLVESQRKVYGSILKLYFNRPRFYRDVEQERQRLGSFEQSPDAPRYSVCVCNYNMADTLDRAMSSVAGQLDPRLYEVLVIDDGSTDNSLEVLEHLAKRFLHFRYISLPRDARRKLGETRNISIRAARGEYVLLHIDADDEWEPYLSDLVTLFHKMEEAVGYDFLLVGQQTGIAKRDFLLSHGPYKNFYRFEDRNMMTYLAAKQALLFLDYRIYRTRMTRPIKKKVMKTLIDTASQLLYEMRQAMPIGKKIKYAAKTVFEPITGNPYSSFRISLLRSLLAIPIFMISRFYKPIKMAMSWTELGDYHEAKRGNYQELMTRWGMDPDLSFLRPESQKIYSFTKKLSGFRGGA